MFLVPNFSKTDGDTNWVTKEHIVFKRTAGMALKRFAIHTKIFLIGNQNALQIKNSITDKVISTTTLV